MLWQRAIQHSLCHCVQTSAAFKNKVVYWHSWKHFDSCQMLLISDGLSKDQLYNPKTLLLTIYSTVLKVQFYSFAVYYTFQKNAHYHSSYAHCYLLFPKMFMCNNMALYWTLVNAYWHSCITKVFDEWQLVGVALYWWFPSVNL